ncbi:MAG: site-specific DNA-methyltransferase [Holophagaceae bacterium]|nr:site-specific DNA-methyltransferase [Holophagaceae bacterium]
MPTTKKPNSTAKAKKATKAGKTAVVTVETIIHDTAKRPIIPTAEQSAIARPGDITPINKSYQRRDPDLDPQLIWRGKYDQQAMEEGQLLVRAPALYIQEKVHPKALIDDLKRETESRINSHGHDSSQPSLFADFNGIPQGVDRTEFYKHEQNWANRLILGDSLQVMAGLSEREGLRGKVQCIYFDPPYGIKFNSNFQWSTTSRDVKDGKAEHITREPEQVKAFRDTWKDGIHSYLGYIRDRLILARELLTESGSIFVQIGDENVHRVRAVMDEVFGEGNFVSAIICAKTSSSSEDMLSSVADYVMWYSKNKTIAKYRPLFSNKIAGEAGGTAYRRIIDGKGNVRPAEPHELSDPDSLQPGLRLFAADNITSQRPSQGADVVSFEIDGKKVSPGKGTFKTDLLGLTRLNKANRIGVSSGNKPAYRRFFTDFPVFSQNNIWSDTLGQNQFGGDKIYVVQTALTIIQRCILMATDPGDLVLDPTCGSGTTAYVAEQWGRRWITIDTSRVALALARARLMGARYPYYLLADSPEGQAKEASVTHSVPSSRPTYGNINHGFVYERVPHITLKSIANNAEIDVIWDKWQEKLEPLRQQLNKALKNSWEEWEIPREPNPSWSDSAKKAHASWWEARIARQKEIDASIAAKADTEYLFDKPYTDKNKVRVAGPFTVESLSPHRMLPVDENGDTIDPMERAVENGARDFASIILEELKTAGVQQTDKADRIEFDSLRPWPGHGYICGEGIYTKGDNTRRAAIFIGPELGSVGLEDLKSAAREAAQSDFDDLIACAFNYHATANEFANYGKVNVLKARMNADLHMSTDLKNTGTGNLFVIFGEPDIDIETTDNNQLRVVVKGVDVFDPREGKVRSGDTDKIACWFIDTNYNEESFFVRHAYFLGANDPYKALQTSLKAEIDRSAWESLHSDTSRPFDRPRSGRIAVKVINYLGDEVMKVYRV